MYLCGCRCLCGAPSYVAFRGRVAPVLHVLDRRFLREGRQPVGERETITITTDSEWAVDLRLQVALPRCTGLLTAAPRLPSPFSPFSLTVVRSLRGQPAPDARLVRRPGETKQPCSVVTHVFPTVRSHPPPPLVPASSPRSSMSSRRHASAAPEMSRLRIHRGNGIPVRVEGAVIIVRAGAMTPRSCARDHPLPPTDAHPPLPTHALNSRRCRISAHNIATLLRALPPSGGP